MSVREQVRAEERSAREQQAHMARMTRESQAARVATERTARREAQRVLRGRIKVAEGDERRAHREYERWSVRYSDAADEHAEAIGGVCDEKFKAAIAATDEVQRLRRELDES